MSKNTRRKRGSRLQCSFCSDHSSEPGEGLPSDCGCLERDVSDGGAREEGQQLEMDPAGEMNEISNITMSSLQSP